ncbi:hypothetical protein [Absidia glauca]|uniref:Uncharacterized protein n=1 Tax=Absidia glauca TaxID=4829 RepID=A0A168RVW7_ABSGL|nr:hypothetical protein [Absidia glauca]
MSFPPNSNSNNNDDPQSELELLEGLLNNMFSGATSMLFKTLQDPFLVEIDPSQQAPGQQRSYSPMLEDLDGSDFRRIAEKRRRLKQQDGETSAQDSKPDSLQQGDSLFTAPNLNNNPPALHNVISISNHENNLGSGLAGLFSSLLGDFEQQQSMEPTDNNNQGNGWTFTSSSSSRQRTVQPDGTEEIVVTTRRNGRTETTTTIRHPDGTIQESQNTSDRPSVLSLLSSLPTSPPSSSSSDNSAASSPSPLANNPISNLLRSIWG